MMTPPGGSSVAAEGSYNGGPVRLSWAECARKEHDVGNRKQVLLLIDDVLALEGRGLEFTASTPCWGAVPELDSMAVIGIINALEEQFDFIIGDDEDRRWTFGQWARWSISFVKSTPPSSSGPPGSAPGSQRGAQRLFALDHGAYAMIGKNLQQQAVLDTTVDDVN